MNLQLRSGGAVDVSEVCFGREFNEALVHQVVTAYLAAGRAGTSAQKTRAEVAGGGRKPWKQKGSGRARAGSTRSPIWRSGGVTFASETRDYSQKVNRKMYRGAMACILSELVRQDRLVVVETFDVDAPKTKAVLAALDALGVGNALIVSDQVSENLYLGARNLPKVEVTDVNGTNPVSLVAHEKVVITVAALKKFEEMFK